MLEQILARMLRVPPDSSVAEFADAVLPHLGCNTELAATVRGFLEQQNPESDVARSARETATHFIWPLVVPQFGGPGIFLHEFKDFAPGVAGYANTVHNHRYHFVTRILRGGYSHETYHVVRDPLDPERASVADHESSVELRAAATLALGRVEYHRVTNVAAETLTLVLKSAPLADRSYSVNVATKSMSSHVPTEERLQCVCQKLLNIGGGSAPHETTHEAR